MGCGSSNYPHKILTGRREQLQTMRQKGGLSGFPKRSESEFDTFGVGHSDTSLSAALGMAMASAQKGEERKTVAVIGDGAMTGGAQPLRQLIMPPMWIRFTGSTKRQSDVHLT